MNRVFRGAFFGILLGIVGGIAWGNLEYVNMKSRESTTAILTMANNENVGDVTKSVLRFHIRANSDSVEDQMLKMNVKEYVLSVLQPIMESATDFQTAKNILSQKLPYIKTVVESYMQDQGYAYNAEVYFATEYFPLKQYGDATFPAGTYEALRIDIGEKEGQNWWCVVYPSLCFVDATHAELPMEDKEKLKQLLTPGEYEEVMQEGNAEEDKVFFHFQIVDLIKKWLPE